MVVIHLLRGPVWWQLCFQDGMSRARPHIGRDQPQPLGDAVVMAVDGEGRHPQGTKEEGSGAGFGADAID